MSIARRHAHLGLILMALVGAMQIAAEQQSADPKKPLPIDLPAEDGGANAKWLEKIAPADREALDEILGKPVVVAPASVEWLGGVAQTAFTNGVTVIQSAQDKPLGLSAAEKLKKMLPANVKLIAVIVPTDAEKIKNKFEKKAPCLIALDPEGSWSELLGLPNKPTNLVVDQSGNIRFAGLTADGAKRACAFLLAQKSDTAGAGGAGAGGAGPGSSGWEGKSKTLFPNFTNAVTTASDQRGKQLIPFFVQEWITKQPKMTKKLLVIDFWATWCPPCRASIPHMNELASKFAADAVCVGISDEKKSAFDAGMLKNKLEVGSFKYSLALDPTNTLSSFFKVRGIPSCAVVSSDGIVRWQGQPMELDDSIMTQLVEAQKSLNTSAKKK